MSRQNWTVFLVRYDSSYLDVKLQEIRHQRHCLVQNLILREAEVNEFLPLRNQQAIAPENFGREKHLSPLLIPTMSKDMDERLKLAQKVIDIVNQANRTICVILLRCNMKKPESS